MGKTLDDLFHLMEQMNHRMARIEQRMDAIEQRMDAIEQRMDAIEQRMDAIEQRMDRIEQRMDGFEERLNGHEEMLSSLIQMAGKNNALWEETTERLDHIQNDVQEMKETLKKLQRNGVFYEKKMFQHEKHIHFLAEQMKLDVEMYIE